MNFLTHLRELKNSCAVILLTVTGVFLAVINFPAFNGFRNRAEFPGDAPLTVDFLPGFLAQFPLRDKLRHLDHLLPDGIQGKAASPGEVRGLWHTRRDSNPRPAA